MIKKYGLEGHYLYDMLPEGKGDLEGTIEVVDNGAFEGEIIDHGSSRAPQQVIKGNLYEDLDIQLMQFLKFPQHNNLANLAYVVGKEFDGKLAGTYVGNWGALPYKISFDKENNLYSAAIDLSVAGIGDEAKLLVFKK